MILLAFVRPGFFVGFTGLYPRRRSARCTERSERPPLTSGETMAAILAVESSRVVEFLDIVSIINCSIASVSFFGRPIRGASST